LKQPRKLPNWYNGWLDYMEDSESPILYHKWVAVNLIASALGRRVYISWEKQVYPNFFILLVGPAGCRKGTAMSPGKEMLREIGIKIIPDSITTQRMIEKMQEMQDPYTTPDGQMHIAAEANIYSEEFTVFIGYNDKEKMQLLANWYDCLDHWEYETKHQGKNYIDGVWLNLIGATTPILLQDSLPRESFGGGLNSRIIYVVAEKKEKIVIFPFLNREKRQPLRDKLIADLQSMRMLYGEFETSESFRRRWEQWYPTQQEIPMQNDFKMAGYIERRATHILKLCMVMNAARNGGMIITEEDFNQSLLLLEETEVKMPKAFAGVGRSKTAAVMQRVLEVTKMRGEIPFSELVNQFWNDADSNTMCTIIATLERGKLIEIDRSQIDGFRDFIVKFKEERNLDE